MMRRGRGGSATRYCLVAVMSALAVSAPQAAALPADSWESSVLLRSFYDRLSPSSGLPRFGALQAQQWRTQASRRVGGIDAGVDAAVFGALRLDGSSNAGNRTLVAPDGTTSHRTSWAYPALAALSVASDHAQVKAGLQAVNNPFLQPDETRALPPTFRGISASMQPALDTVLEAGSFNATIARGQESARSLTTSYGGTKVDRFEYVGGHGGSDAISQVFLVGRARDVWRQAFSSTSIRLGESPLGIARAKLNVYVTRGDGRQLQGPIDTTAASVAFSTGTPAASATLGLQQIFGNQVFDYLAETNGIFLANVYGGDYNAPHERSVQLRLRMNGAVFGLAGLDLGAWATSGWKADASKEAALHPEPADALHKLYWRNGRSAQGTNRELGMRVAYRFSSGCLKGAQVWLMTMAHRQSLNYPGSAYDKTQFVLQVPIGLGQGPL